jgi:hypothetical protein
MPVRGDPAHASACAKAADKSTCPSAGTSVIARIPNACAKSAAGRPPSAKPNGARMKRSKPSTPRRNGRAVNAPRSRRKHQIRPKLRRRVVTHQKFLPFFCAAARGAMKRPPSRTAGRHVSAVPPVARRFVGWMIANASGCGATLSKAVRPANGSTPPLARGAPDRGTTAPTPYHRLRRPRELIPPQRRSAVCCRGSHAP